MIATRVERQTGLEPAASGLGSRRSTIELLPQNDAVFPGRHLLSFRTRPAFTDGSCPAYQLFIQRQGSCKLPLFRHGLSPSSSVTHFRFATVRYYPNHSTGLERIAGIEPAFPAWEAGVLPMNHIRR